MALPSLNFTKLDIPPSLEVKETSFSHESEKVDVRVSAEESVKVHIEKVVKKSNADGDSDRYVLFLHGQRFSSKNWLDINTVFHVANWGWKAIAVDLPGYGQTKETANSDEFLHHLITTLGLKKPVIVSPSMSGFFSLPYLFGDGVDGSERATGFIPVAPVNTSPFVNNYSKSKLRTLIVYGTNDTQLGTASNKDFAHLPNGQYAPIQDAGHACYLNNPDAFHIYLYHFLQQL